MTMEDVLHDLWGKAADSPGYDKRQWVELQGAIERLQASRADLLAACEAQSAPAAHFGQCHQCGADLRGNLWHCPEYLRLFAKARDMARDAIAKAKGV